MEIYGGLMRRSFLLFTIIVVIITAFSMNILYKQNVHYQKQRLKSNIRYPNEQVSISGIITELDVENNTFIIKTTSNQVWLIRTQASELIKKIYDE